MKLGQLSCLCLYSEPPGLRERRCEITVGQRAPVSGTLEQRNEAMIRELFDVQDLNGNGLIEEAELVRLNERISWLHHGRVDRNAVREKFTHVFRTKLDPQGRPVPFGPFRSFIREVLRELDPDPKGQEMILEQFIAEARSGRELARRPSLQSLLDEPPQLPTLRRSSSG